MATDDPRGGGAPIAGLTIVALLVSATIFAPAPFQLLRPPEPEGFRYDLAKDQDVDARLWEDPFAAARRFEDSLRKDGKTPSPGSSDPAQCDKAANAAKGSAPADRHGVCHFRTRLASHFSETGAKSGVNARTTLLGVMVQGNSFVGAEEGRRRIRYAVIAGLNAAGYQPANPEQIGYFRTEIRVPATDGFAAERQALVVPFERFDLREGGVDQVVVLWLDEAALSGRWVAKLASFLAAISPSCSKGGDQLPSGEPHPIRILGPSTSDMLATASEELRRPPKSDALRCGFGLLNQARLLSPFATAPDARLRAARSEAAFAPGFRDGIATRAKQAAPGFDREVLLRTIITDDRLLKALSAELVQRGVDACDADGRARVAVIGEWDSLYARSLAAELETALQVAGRAKQPAGRQCKLDFAAYSYLRGLDGVTVGKKPSQQENGERPGDTAKEKSIEWPEGRDQRDYLRRLATRMREDAARAGRQIAAVGVLGTDVHDKLLVLQALRPTLPDALFFTTDLDARLFHPRTFEWTRNLLVATSFDLALGPALQGDVPPFRDVYQTAAFLATQVALHDADVAPTGAFARWKTGNGTSCAGPLSPEALAGWLDGPRLYELGRGTPIALADTASRDCNVHPPEALKAPAAALVITSWVVMALAGFALLVVPSTISLRRLRPCSGADGRRWPCIYVLAFVELVAFFFTCAVLWRLFRGLPGSAAVAAFWAGALALTAMSVVFPGMPWVRRTFERVLRKRVELGSPVGDAGATALHLAVAIVVLVALAMVIPSTPGTLEPFDFWVGVSVWPTELLRLVALLLAVIFLDYAWFGAMENGDRLTRRYFKGEPRGLIQRSRRYWRGLHRARPGPLRPLVRAGNWFLELGIWSLGWRWFLKGRRCEPLRAVRGALLWAEYIRRGQGWRRLFRVVFWALVTIALGVLCFALLGDSHGPQLPARGDVNRQLFNATLAAAMIAFVVLIVTIADATMLLIKFVRALQAGRTAYPAATVEHFATELGDRSRAYWVRPIAAHVTQRDCSRDRFNSLLDDWIDIQLIAERSEWIGRLIYAPFLILALLIVARSPFFDNWTLPPALAVTFAGYLVWAMVLAILLQVVASRARSTALARMREDLLWLQGTEGVPPEVAGQFGELTERVRTIRKGAFLPFAEQPLVRAALVPLGSAGGVQVVQYLLLLQH